MSIAPGELNDIETSTAPLTDLQANAEILTRRIWRRIPTYQSGVETTTVGPPTSGSHVEDEHWVDALTGEWVCTVAGTPGTWKQHRPAVTEGEPADPSIPVGYLIWDADDGFTTKSHAGSAMWMEEEEIYRVSNAKATTYPLEYTFFIRSDDASNPLQIRLGLRTHATGGSRYAAIDVEDADTGRILALQPSGGLTLFGTSPETVAPAATVHIVDTTEQFRVAYDASTYWKDTTASGGARTIAGVGGVGSQTDFEIDTTGGATNGNFIFNTSQLFIDGTSANVGIGTAPAGIHRLDVDGGSKSAPVNFSSSNPGSIVLTYFTNSAPASTSNQVGFSYRANSDTTLRDVARIQSKFVDIADATRSSVLLLRPLKNGAFIDTLALYGTGHIGVIANTTTDTAPNDDVSPKRLSIQKLSSAPTNAAYIAFSNNPGSDSFYLVLEED